MGRDDYNAAGVPWYCDPRTPRPIPPHLIEALGPADGLPVQRAIDRRQRYRMAAQAVEIAWQPGDMFRLAACSRCESVHVGRLGRYMGIRRHRTAVNIVVEWIDPPTRPGPYPVTLFQFVYMARRIDNEQ